ncbi:hypothetical protein KEM48_011220 [Puccinia striiformis f. sp. tritici PST-130]|nr:hypothetical protein KEM48_011220 [Puccinia striiformis f. sp. tritici PST-130]
MSTPISLAGIRGLRRTTHGKVYLGFLIILCHCILFAMAMESSSLQLGRISGGSSPMFRSPQDYASLRGGSKDEGITRCDDTISSSSQGESNTEGTNADSQLMSNGISDLDGGRALTDEDLIARDNLLTKFTEAQRLLRETNRIYTHERTAVIQGQEAVEVLKIEATDKIHDIVKELENHPHRDENLQKLIRHLEGPGLGQLGAELLFLLRSAVEELLKSKEHEKKSVLLRIARFGRHKHAHYDSSVRLRELRGMLKAGQKEFREEERAAIHRLSLIDRYGFTLSKDEIHLIKHMPLGRHHVSSADQYLLEIAIHSTAVQRIETLVVNTSQYYEDLYEKSTVPTIKDTLDTIRKSLETLRKKLKEGDLWTPQQTELFHSLVEFRAQKDGEFPSFDDWETEQSFKDLLEERKESKTVRLLLKAFANLSSDPENLSKSDVGKKLSNWWVSDYSEEYDNRVKMIGTIRSTYDLIETAKHYLGINKSENEVDEAAILKRKYYATELWA